MAYVMLFAIKQGFDGGHSYEDGQIGAGEVILWILNLAYVLYEFNELADKGKEYLNVKSMDNFFDILISIIWFILFILRFLVSTPPEVETPTPTEAIIDDMTTMDDDDADYPLTRAYIALFGIQILLIAIRSLLLFQISPYLGVQLKVIERMSVELFKFAMIAGIVILGFWFGLWYICGFVKLLHPNEEFDDFICNESSIFAVGWYVFQLFVGVGDPQNVSANVVTVIFTIIILIVGTITLLNLMIALMSTKYERINENAKEEIILNKTITTLELGNQRQRLMPPPLNILSIVICIIIHIINFITSMINPQTLNVYCYIDHRYYAFWKDFSCKKCNIFTNKISAEYERDNPKPFYKTRMDVVRYYFYFLYAYLDKNNYKGLYKLHHKGCYSCLKMHETQTINGIEMKEYCKIYEKESKLKFDPLDKSLLNYLTFELLFCEHCYRAFVPKNIENDLLTPFRSLLDIVSCFLFVLFPIAWIPLIIIYAILALIELCTKTSKSDNNVDYSSYDREYLPENM